MGAVFSTPSAPADFEAYRWTEEEGFELLGVLGPPGDVFSSALAASADGSVIVGVARGVGRTLQGFVWTSEMGIRSLRNLSTPMRHPIARFTEQFLLSLMLRVVVGHMP